MVRLCLKKFCAIDYGCETMTSTISGIKSILTHLEYFFAI